MTASVRIPEAQSGPLGCPDSAMSEATRQTVKRLLKRICL